MKTIRSVFTSIHDWMGTGEAFDTAFGVSFALTALAVAFVGITSVITPVFSLALTALAVAFIFTATFIFAFYLAAAHFDEDSRTVHRVFIYSLNILWIFSAANVGMFSLWAGVGVGVAPILFLAIALVTSGAFRKDMEEEHPAW